MKPSLQVAGRVMARLVTLTGTVSGAADCARAATGARPANKERSRQTTSARGCLIMHASIVEGRARVNVRPGFLGRTAAVG